jgi:hypothetical protein
MSQAEEHLPKRPDEGRVPAPFPEPLPPRCDDHPRPRRNKLLVILIVSVVGVVVLIGGGFAVLVYFRAKATEARVHSINNLKQMGLAMHRIAARVEGLLPPSAGGFPPGASPKGSIFFHMLPDIEQGDIYRQYKDDSSKVPDTTTITTYCAPLDPSNPGVNMALTSYASNAAVFGLLDGGNGRYPAMFKAIKGTANTVLFFERYASAGPGPERHSWYGTGDQENYLYPPRGRGVMVGDWPTEEDFTPPQFNVNPEQANPRAPHAIASSVIYVGLADATVRPLKNDIPARAWAWACNIRGPLAERPKPTGW